MACQKLTPSFVIVIDAGLMLSNEIGNGHARRSAATC